MRCASRFGVALVSLLGALVPTVGLAGEALRDDPKAREFFEVGAQAYAKGQYLLAIDAFEQAYALTERPGLLFSLAQAHQRQFRVSGDEAHLAKAIDGYRSYLSRVTEGGRRADAERSLSSLLEVAARLQGREREATDTKRPFGRLLLSSATPGVRVSVNGEPVDALPTALELPVGHYRVEASAPGFDARAQDVAIAEEASTPLNFELEALPAVLEISGPPGAEALLDGRSLGWLPLGSLRLDAGEHWISVRKPGHKTRSALARLGRGEKVRVDLPLETTVQRDATWVLLGGATLAAGASVTLAVLAWHHDAEAETLEQRRQHEGITLAEGRRLNQHVQDRERLQRYAVLSGVSAAAFTGAALIAYLTDTPAAPRLPDVRRSKEPPPLDVTPVLGSAWGFAARGSF